MENVQVQTTSTTNVVLSQTNDLLTLYHSLFQTSTQNVEEYQLAAKTELTTLYRELEVERLRHQETRGLLADETSKLHVLDSQLSALQRQLSREQTTFERAFGMLQERDLNVSPQKMATQIAALQANCQQKEDELKHKEQIIAKLYKTIQVMKDKHKREMDELRLELKHKTYLNQSTKSSTTRKTARR